MQADNPTTFEIRILLFATARECAGTSELELTIGDGASVADALGALVQRHAKLAALLPSLLVAVNEEWVPRSTQLKSGDTLAVMPPVSGG